MSNALFIDDPMPQPIRMGRHIESSLSHAFITYQDFVENKPRFKSESGLYVMGYSLPVWQRDFTWTQEQCESLINNIWKKLPIGDYMVNMVEEIDHPLDGLLIDGQQRLTAIQMYVENKFPVQSASGDKLFWDDLPLVSKRRFKNTSFAHTEINSTDINFLMQCYATLNYGGTAHTELDKEKFLSHKP